MEPVESFKFYYTNGDMIKREFRDAGEASEFAFMEGDHLVRWCVDRDEFDYNFVNGFWITE